MIVEVYTGADTREEKNVRIAHSTEEILCPGKPKQTCSEKGGWRYGFERCGGVMEVVGVVEYSNPEKAIMQCPHCGAKTTVLM